MTADAYATALMVLGYKEARKLIELDDSLDAILIYSDESGNINTWDSRAD
jgi:thiamine biosynthesis lipoprotein